MICRLQHIVQQSITVGELIAGFLWVGDRGGDGDNLCEDGDGDGDSICGDGDNFTGWDGDVSSSPCQSLL